MTFEQFDAYCEDLLKDIRKMRDTKGKEYAGDRDRFANFNEIAEETGIPRLQVWHVYFMKHIKAINSYVRHGHEFSDENIRGRIVDAMTYLALGAGIIAEDGMNSYNKQDEIDVTTHGDLVKKSVIITPKSAPEPPFNAKSHPVYKLSPPALHCLKGIFPVSGQAETIKESWTELVREGLVQGMMVGVGIGKPPEKTEPQWFLTARGHQYRAELGIKQEVNDDPN